ncbi:sensor histidine kinase [uncultured Sphingomonas sp.]|uniref:sensor histidine kinase n=1 Tax=uncultured Sphingomonas sp. TaxID=158754 RepID=UPI0035CAB0E2
MIRAPRSIVGRMLAIAALTTLAALLFAGVAIGHVLERLVMHGLDDRLDAQIGVIARAVRPDATIDRDRIVDLPGFDEPDSGWVWSVDAPGDRHWQSARQMPLAVPRPLPPRRDDGPPPPGTTKPPVPAEPHAHPGDARLPGGERIHLRILTVATPAGPVTITASGPRRVVDAPLHEAMTPLLLSLTLLGVALAAATVVQLRLGLRPLGRLRDAIGAVRSGRQGHVPTDQPTELAPLAIELNALIDQNAAGLAHARRHVANLAHGLKTPLAALALKLSEGDRDPDGSMADAVAAIDRRVRHHLARARAATPGAAVRARAPVGDAVKGLVTVLARINAGQAIAVKVAIDPMLAVAVDPQDLDEMIGNLLDNAWRHTRSRITVAAAMADGLVAITIDDDGPGLDPAMVTDALLPGRRLDERGDGHGFGLSITHELAELNGGALTLGRAAIGGLAVRLTLPVARGG